MAQPQFKQYREADGRFHFKLVHADGHALLVSEGFATPREAGTLVTFLKQGGEFEVAGNGVFVAGERVAELAPDVVAVEVREALAAL
ncbi:hypothetical protein RZS08_56890, partial [Arthrospira platensis SPKY1]|nr:hypothetical protein [Arthrospira platensis SPKY1]